MVLVVVLEPSRDLAGRGNRIRQGIYANIVVFEGFDEALRYMSFDCGLWTGVKQAMRLNAVATSRFLGRVGAATIR